MQTYRHLHVFPHHTEIQRGKVGLYGDNGLAVCRAKPKRIKKTKQEASKIFKSNGLKITIKANKKP